MIIALAGQKGGAGKSTIVTCLAAEALHRGHTVLLGDADPQRTALTWYGEALARKLPAPTTIALDATMAQPKQLPRLAAGFDLVLIDCPPRLDSVQRAAMMVADVTVLPCPPSDAWALTESIKIVQEAKNLRPSLCAAVLITMKRPRTALGKNFRNALQSCGLPVMKTEVTDRIAYQEARLVGMGASTYTPKDAAATEIQSLLDELITLIEEQHD